MASDNDTGYKLLFSHPAMVRDLIAGYVSGDWVRDADFSTLERINASYVSDNERSRHDDMVWRVRVGGSWLWVYLLLEFQSRPDRWMAVRMLVYLGLLAQDLIRRNETYEGKLPPILPLRRAFGVWVKTLLIRKAPAHRISEVASINDIMEADTMLADRIEGWFEEATRKGMEQGIQQGEARLLLHQIILRFGPVPEEVVHRIESADADTLLQWSERLLGASTLEEVVL